MKKYINRIAGIMLFLTALACSEELIVDEVIDSVASGGVLRNLGETNLLDISDGGTTYTIVLEAQDASGGNLLQEVIVNVGFNDIDEDENDLDTVAISEFARIPASEFRPETSTTNNGLPATSFSTTLNQLVDHVGGTLTAGTATSVEATDAFTIDFQMVLTDGRVFEFSNATGDVTRTGTFSFFNGQFRYFPTIGDPKRIVLNSVSVADDNELGLLKDDDVDTVFLTFNQEDAFTTDPVISILTTTMSTDADVIGSLGALTAIGDDSDSDNDKTYYALYTAGNASVDTISFVISGAETVTDFTMVNDTLKSAFIIDNAVPKATLGASSIEVSKDSITNINLEFTFTEALGQDTVMFIFDSNTVQFTTDTVSAVIASGSTSVSLDFSPLGATGLAIPNGALDFDVFTDFDPSGSGTPTGGIIDLIGNQEPDSVRVQL